MYKRKPIKITALLLTFCLLMTALSGTAIRIRAEELGTFPSDSQIRSSLQVTSMPFVFRHFYDSATFSSKTSYINSAVSLVNHICMFNFPALATSTTDYPISVDYCSGLNNCPTGLERPCLASWSCGGNVDHHKDIENISDNLLAWRTRNYGRDNENMGHIVVLWTDYDGGIFCHYHKDLDSGIYVHEYLDSLGNVSYGRPVIQIMNICTSNSSHYTPHMGILLAHELAHSIGLVDQYEPSSSAVHGPGNTMNCIMDYFADQAIEDGRTVYPAVEFRNRFVTDYDLAFCDNCDEQLTNFLQDWIYVYNSITG